MLYSSKCPLCPFSSRRWVWPFGRPVDRSLRCEASPREVAQNEVWHFPEGITADLPGERFTLMDGGVSKTFSAGFRWRCLQTHPTVRTTRCDRRRGFALSDMNNNKKSAFFFSLKDSPYVKTHGFYFEGFFAVAEHLLFPREEDSIWVLCTYTQSSVTQAGCGTVRHRLRQTHTDAAANNGPSVHSRLTLKMESPTFLLWPSGHPWSLQHHSVCSFVMHLMTWQVTHNCFKFLLDVQAVSKLSFPFLSQKNPWISETCLCSHLEGNQSNPGQKLNQTGCRYSIFFFLLPHISITADMLLWESDSPPCLALLVPRGVITSLPELPAHAAYSL